jgi:selenocysteine-specific elongation factor
MRECAVKVVGTAGHIDHGKSTLVHRLTGIDPDRLAEEKRRGMTIDLGFAWLELANGEAVSIVDVPGHERFIANMLAGAAGIDVALLAVAADEGVMPQTREHLDILMLLGIRRGLVALTKADLVDGDMLELATLEVIEALGDRGFQSWPVIPVSAVNGTGLDDLLAELQQSLGELSDAADLQRPYLPVDRVFTVAGFGTVVTGTLHGGSISVGDEVEVQPAGRVARVRSLQTHGHDVKTAELSSRVAVNLAGIDRDQVSRGDVVALPGVVMPARRFDAAVQVTGDSVLPLRHNERVMLHTGAGEHAATVSVLDATEILPGESGWIQLRSAGPVPAVPGQRFVLRMPSPARTIAGGTILDLRPRHRRGDSAAIERLQSLSSSDSGEVVRAASDSGRLLTVPEIAAAARTTRELAATHIERLVKNGDLVRIGEQAAGPRVWEAVTQRAIRVLSAYHAAHPRRRGMPSEELRARMRRPRAEWSHWVAALHGAGHVSESGGELALHDFTPLADTTGTVAQSVVRALEETGAPCHACELRDRAGCDESLLRAMVDEGQIIHIGGGLYLLPERWRQLVDLTLDLIEREGSVTVATFRDATQTSRRYSLAFLEHLDSRRITRRVGDVRVRGREASACA